MSSNALVAHNQNGIDHSAFLYKRIKRALDFLSVRLCYSLYLRSVLAQPFAKFIGPIFDQTAGANDDDAFRRWLPVGCDTGL